MADDEAAPPEAEATEEPASSDTEETESTDEEESEEAEAGPVDDYQGLLDNQEMVPQPSTSSQPPCYGQ